MALQSTQVIFRSEDSPPQQQPSNSKALLFVGDSDIARWPPELLPNLDAEVPPTVSGHNGATLQEIIPHVEKALQTLGTATDTVVLVACAGENDIGSGVSLEDILSAFDELLRTFFGNAVGISRRRLIFLGPKIEPWLKDDPASRKQYVKLSLRLRSSCSNHERAHEIQFVDCLTMFCGETANVPGATLGRKARADPIYFENDELHLNRQGYQVWQEVVENLLADV